MPRRTTILLITGFVVILSFAQYSSAQTFTGTVAGHILDAQQNAVPGTTVTLRSSEREFERRTTSDPQGEYAFDLVPPGWFTVIAEHSGFSPTTLRVEVVVARPVRGDLVLRIQSVQEALRVVGEGGISVQTETASLGRVISPHEMTELPSVGRSPYDFIALVPGATASNDGIGVGFAVNGGRTQSANYVLDGAESNDIFMSAPAMDIPLDAIQEFNIQTNHFSAEYGRNSGFTANIVTKSGGKDVHGTLYDYVRNSALAANSFGNNANGLPRPVFNRNQFGGTLGGPVVRSKLFFFASTEGIVVRSSGSNLFYVPTPELLAISSPGTQAIFERFPLPTNLSLTDVRREPICPFGVSCDDQSGAGIVTIPAFTLTSRVGPHDFGAGAPQNTILGTGRLDWILRQHTQAFLRYAIENKDEFGVADQPYSKALDQASYGLNQNVAVEVIHIWSPRFATESRVAYDRVTGDPDRLGGNTYTVPNPALPFFYILNESVTLPDGTSGGFGPTNGYQFFQTATYTRGKHTLRFGGQFTQLRQNYTFGFAGQIADAQFANTQGFVDGRLQFYSIALDSRGHYPGEYLDPPFGPPSFTRHYRYNEPALFIEDDWKVTRRLTLTPGLRWEYFGIFHSPGAEHTLDSNFYPGSGSNLLEQIANGRMLRTIDAPGSLQGRFYLPDYKNFAPRLGLAYDLFGDGKTVFRAGGGIFYDRRVGWELFRAYQNPPSYSFTQLTNITVTRDLVTNQYAAFPNAPIQLSQSVTQDPDTHLSTAYTGSWNATMEREFAGLLVAGVSYLGSSGSRLYSLNNINRIGSDGLLDPSCISTRIASDGVTPIGPDYSNCPRLNATIKNIGLRGNGGHSSYDALQLRMDSRLIPRLGLEFGANYTCSHSIDNRSVSGTSNAVAEIGNGYLDAFEPSLDRGPSDFDVRHRFAGNFIWQIPLRKRSNWVARYVLAGWEISGFLNYQTGQPFSIGDSGTPDATTERTRPRLTGPPPRVGSLIPDSVSPDTFLYLPVNEVYDPTSGRCISNAKPFACEISVNGPFGGTLPRNSFRQPGLFFQDTALIKNFPLSREGTQVQFRAEFYNLYNHPNLYVNGTSTDVGTSSFTNAAGLFAAGVTASYQDNRQIVLALKFLF
jgi:Carboxypeptidase regulatory-like domain/TonB dependent receptor